MAKATKKATKLTKKEFVLRAIKALRNEDKSRGIHSVYSGFNAAFKKQFDCETSDVITFTKKLEDDGVIVIQPRKGGVMLYVAGEEPGNGKTQASKGDDALAKILAL